METVYQLSERTSLDTSAKIIHQITCNEEHEGGWYRQISIVEGLVNRSLNRWYDFWHQKRFQTHNTVLRFNRWQDYDTEIYNDSRERLVGLNKPELDADNVIPELVFIKHDSVYAFLEHIGYDYKDKKVSNIDKLILITPKQ